MITTWPFASTCCVSSVGTTGLPWALCNGQLIRVPVILTGIPPMLLITFPLVSMLIVLLPIADVCSRVKKALAV